MKATYFQCCSVAMTEGNYASNMFECMQQSGSSKYLRNETPNGNERDIYRFM